MIWKSIISTVTLSLVFLVTACASSEESGESNLIGTYRAHLTSAQSTVSHRMDSESTDVEYYEGMTEHLDAMAEIREEMDAECTKLDGCPGGGGLASHGSEGKMGSHMGDSRMLTADEMRDLESGEASIHAELDEFEVHCQGEDATGETCEAYRGEHLQKMSSMLESHDEMCGRMMGESGHMDGDLDDDGDGHMGSDSDIEPIDTGAGGMNDDMGQGMDGQHHMGTDDMGGDPGVDTGQTV